MKIKYTVLFQAAIVTMNLLLSGCASPSTDASPHTVYRMKDAPYPVVLAAKEVRRYIYLRTGELLPIVEIKDALPHRVGGMLIAQNHSPAVRNLNTDETTKSTIADLKSQHYLLKTLEQNGSKLLLVTGGDAIGTLYGSYRLAEHLGVRFYLHGEVIPDNKIPFELPALDERAEPLFALRGIQPFHDFPEGPDWWNRDDYLAIISQLPKLRMNFIGLHTYPWHKPNAEPTVWIGLPQDINNDGTPKFSYPSSWQNTFRDNWGYAKKKTSDYLYGAADLFEHDAYGSDVMLGYCPYPAKPEDCNEVFNRAGKLLRDAFTHAHQLGIKTCVGTEIPLRVPDPLKERLKSLGKDPDDPLIVQQLYKGIFQRIIKTYPLDYYWFWTPEGWTWGNIPKPKVQHSINDMLTAVKTAKQMKTPFRLATCGWVLGPQYDRSLFDTILPKDMAVSCINRQVGRTPVDPGFADVAGRDKWAIPWLEDDPALTAAQLWVGRMRRDAFDALQYGCSGLMGIHWRTRILGPNVAALAHAAWDQTGWSDGRAEFSGPIGGRAINYDINPIEGTQDDPLYQTIREGMSAYRLSVPNGTYVVTMKLCEHNYNKPKKRVFDIQIEGGIVAGGVDIFAKVGQSKAFNLTFKEIKVRDKYLDIHFIYNPDGKSLPCISAIEIQGPDYSRKINCGGPAYKDYEADVRGIANYPSTYDFYYDWSLHQFGPEAAEEIAQLFDKIDGQLPRPAQWDKGPGGLKPHFMTGKEIAERYSFVSRFARLRPRIEGAGNLERFDYWLSQFRLLQTMEILRVNWHNYNSFVTEAKKEQDPKQKMQLIKDSVIPVRIDLVQGIEKAYQDLLATVKTAGGMGNVANWEQHIIPKMLTGPGQELTEMMGKDLPAKAMPSQKYTGPARLIVPTVRTSIAAGEELKLKLIILAEKPPHDVILYWRIMGQDEFNKVSATNVKRGVYSATIPKEAATDADFEYHARVATDKGNDLYFPPTAPDINQTVIVMPKDN